VYNVGGMRAVIELKGHQYLVSEGDLFETERTGPVGEEFSPDRVLAVLGESEVRIGQPVVTDYRVTLRTESEGKGKKVRAIRFKPATGLRKTRGHRQIRSIVRVVAIQGVTESGA
jgi:large subunit ribosomal protein L21